MSPNCGDIEMADLFSELDAAFSRTDSSKAYCCVVIALPLSSWDTTSYFMWKTER